MHLSITLSYHSLLYNSESLTTVSIISFDLKISTLAHSLILLLKVIRYQYSNLITLALLILNIVIVLFLISLWRFCRLRGQHP